MQFRAGRRSAMNRWCLDFGERGAGGVEDRLPLVADGVVEKGNEIGVHDGDRAPTTDRAQSEQWAQGSSQVVGAVVGEVEVLCALDPAPPDRPRRVSDEF